MKIWIARDLPTTDDEEFDLDHFLRRHPEKEFIYGKLHLFYDKPEFRDYGFGKGEWVCGRIASDIPSYMFPKIGCGECMEFSAPDNFPEYKRYKGVIMK